MNSISLISFSDKGERLADLLAEKLKNEVFSESNCHITAMRCGQPFSMREWTAENFANADALIFVGACGIAVRAIAPHIKKKTSDPAVVVVDEGGNFAISLLSGHIGGANELAGQIAEICHAIPVITTATDVNGLFAVDAWAVKMDCVIKNPGRIKDVSAALLCGETINLYTRFPIKGEEKQVRQVLIERKEQLLHQGLIEREEQGERISIRSDNEDGQTETRQPDLTYPVILDVQRHSDMTGLLLIPRIAVLGIGCRKGTEEETIERVFESFLEETGIHKESIVSCASIDLKAQETGLYQFCESHDWPIRFYSARELMQVKGDFTASEFVLRTTGVDNVCERSAVCESGGTLFAEKFAQDGVTFALALKEFRPAFNP